MTTHYWPWWLGGLLLATVAVSFPLLVGAPLGVSGALARLLRRRSEGTGRSSAGSVSSEAGAVTPSGLVAPERSTVEVASCGAPASSAGNLVFLVGVLIGGGLAGWASGRTWEHAGLSPEFHRLFGTGLPSMLVLFGGGALVGFGTRWSGGCTSGHGLSGCGRLQPASLIATAVFFGVAIAVSFLLERLLS